MSDKKSKSAKIIFHPVKPISNLKQLRWVVEDSLKYLTIIFIIMYIKCLLDFVFILFYWPPTSWLEWAVHGLNVWVFLAALKGVFVIKKQILNALNDFDPHRGYEKYVPREEL